MLADPCRAGRLGVEQVHAQCDGGRTFVTVARCLPGVLSLRAAVVRGAEVPVGA